MSVLQSGQRSRTDDIAGMCAPLCRSGAPLGRWVIVAKQLAPSTEIRKNTKNTDCFDCEMHFLSSDKPEPAAESFNPGVDCGVKSPEISPHIS